MDHTTLLLILRSHEAAPQESGSNRTKCATWLAHYAPLWVIHRVCAVIGEWLPVNTNKCREWRKDGWRHRIHGPAVIWADGTQQYWDNGNLHRGGDLPAIIHADGSQEWWKHGRRHREGLPAIIVPNRNMKSWWVDGVKIRSIRGMT
jgi:hypothetical protein